MSNMEKIHPISQNKVPMCLLSIKGKRKNLKLTLFLKTKDCPIKQIVMKNTETNVLLSKDNPFLKRITLLLNPLLQSSLMILLALKNYNSDQLRKKVFFLRKNIQLIEQPLNLISVKPENLKRKKKITKKKLENLK